MMCIRSLYQIIKNSFTNIEHKLYSKRILNVYFYKNELNMSTASLQAQFMVSDLFLPKKNSCTSFCYHPKCGTLRLRDNLCRVVSNNSTP